MTTLYDKNFPFIPGGWQPPDRGVHDLNSTKTTYVWSNENQRVSKNPGEGMHWTNQNLPKGHPDRHLPPKPK